MVVAALVLSHARLACLASLICFAHDIDIFIVLGVDLDRSVHGVLIGMNAITIGTERFCCICKFREGFLVAELFALGAFEVHSGLVKWPLTGQFR